MEKKKKIKALQDAYRKKENTGAEAERSISFSFFWKVQILHSNKHTELLKVVPGSEWCCFQELKAAATVKPSVAALEEAVSILVGTAAGKTNQ